VSGLQLKGGDPHFMKIGTLVYINHGHNSVPCSKRHTDRRTDEHSSFNMIWNPEMSLNTVRSAPLNV
jgi:hypothetical protein